VAAHEEKFPAQRERNRHPDFFAHPAKQPMPPENLKVDSWFEKGNRSGLRPAPGFMLAPQREERCGD